MVKLRFAACSALIAILTLVSCKQEEVQPASKDAGTGKDGSYNLVKIVDRRPGMDTTIVNPVSPILSVCLQVELKEDSLIDCVGDSFLLDSLKGWDASFLGDTLFLKSTDSFQGFDDYDMWYLR